MIKRRRGDLNRQQIILTITSSFSILSFLVVIFLAWYIFDKQPDKEVLNNDKQEESGKIVEENFEFDPAKKDINLDLTAEEVVEKVSKHMLLLEGEILVVTVTNADGLREENSILYQYTKNGDKILYYPNGMIIYDANLDKIVDVLRKYPVE
jgi:hypothetical protein